MSTTRGRTRCPQTVAEESGIDAYALVTLNERAEIRRLQEEQKACVGWIDCFFLDLDERLARGATLDEIRAELARGHVELVTFHTRHYEFSVRGTRAVCDEIRSVIRRVNQYVGWWQQRTETRQLAFAEVRS